MASFFYIVISFVLSLIFLTLIVLGFIRFKKPESGPLIIPGFIGLAICVFFFSPMFWFSFVRDVSISFDNYVNLMRLSSIAIFMPSIILFILFILGIVIRDHKYSGEFLLNGGVGALIAFFVVFCAAPGWVHNPVMKVDSEVKSNVQTIQVVLERYGEDHSGLYPERIEILIDDGYMANFPRNPFTLQTSDGSIDQSAYEDNSPYLPMKNVPYGSPDFEGNFTYLPVIIDDEIMGYYLIGYGYKHTPGQDILSQGINDHVIIVLDGPVAHPPEPFPSVQDVLLQPQSSD